MFGIPNTCVCAHRHTMTQRRNWDPQNSATTLHTLAPWEAGDESAPNSTHRRGSRVGKASRRPRDSSRRWQGKASSRPRPGLEQPASRAGSPAGLDLAD